MDDGCQDETGDARAQTRAGAVVTPTVVLVRPREEGNVGAVARAMANMGLRDLVLVEPAPPISGVARGFGVGGWHVLDQVRRTASLGEAVAPFRRLVGTSSVRHRALRRSRVVVPRELPAVLAQDPPGTPTALVFGPEDKGLARDEIDRCHLVVTVPCDPRHPTLNLAHAVLVVAYELRLTSAVATPAVAAPATAAETEALLETAAVVLHRIGFDHPPIHAGLVRDLRRLLARSGASSLETRILRRLLNRALRRLDRTEGGTAE